LPVRVPAACGKYMAKCITSSYRENHPEDQGSRRLRFWGNYPRKVSPQFYRMTKGSRRWRGKLAFCAHVLGFQEYGDFEKCFGPRWFIHLKAIIRLVPIPIAEASLHTRNLPLNLLQNFRQPVAKIKTELLDRLERFGRPIKWKSATSSN
jgi:hypothetical protein